MDAISQTGHRGNTITSGGESDNDREQTSASGASEDEALLVVGAEALVIAGAKVLVVDRAKVGRPPERIAVGNIASG